MRGVTAYSTVRAAAACAALAVCVALAMSTTAFAQWLKHPTAAVPTTADGKPNFFAPAPRTPDGKPDFTGIWLTGNPLCGQAIDPVSLTCGWGGKGSTSAQACLVACRTSRGWPRW
jgi:hypothetical protein